MSLQPQAGSSGGLASTSNSSKRKLLFVGSPRAQTVKSLEDAKKILTYERFVENQDTPKTIIQALRTAPEGLVFQEPADKEEEFNIYWIHDLASVLLSFEYSYLTLFSPAGLGHCFFKWRVDASMDELVCISGHCPSGKFQPYPVYAQSQAYGRRVQPGDRFLVHLHFFFYLDITSDDYLRQVHPGLDKTNFDRFWVNLLNLSKALPMFPHPQDLYTAACKMQRDNHLMTAAMGNTMTPFLRTAHLSTKQALLEACAKKVFVIKRDFSDSTSCTYLPTKEGPEARKQLVSSKWDETLRVYNGIHSLPAPVWMAQVYNPHLLEKGELRAFVVGGRVRRVIHTLPDVQGEMQQEMVDNFTPLSRLK